MDDDLIASAWRGEKALLTLVARRDESLLTNLLAPDFVEIGQSGRRWSRAEMIDPEMASAKRRIACSDLASVGKTSRSLPSIPSQRAVFLYLHSAGSDVGCRRHPLSHENHY
jgi:hypothetical protein